MHYLREENHIKTAINQLKSYSVLWLDTETADWHNPSLKRLSLLQVLANPEDKTGESVYLFDLLDKNDLINYFIEQIMFNDQIEKVIHNASYDIPFLGGKEKTKNITCTYNLSRKITKAELGTSNLQLKTLATELCGFRVEEKEATSDWSQRPLTSKQLKYAMMDVVFLAHVHQKLAPYHPVFIKNSPPVLKPLTIDNIILGYQCPRLLYLSYHQGGKTQFISNIIEAKVAEQFDDLTTKLGDSLKYNYQFTSLFSKSLNSQDITRDIQQIFYENYIFPKLIIPLIKNKIKLEDYTIKCLLNTWNTLRKLIDLWTHILIINRNYLSSEQLFNHSLISKQIIVSNFNTQNQPQVIKAEIPNLIYNFSEQKLVFIKYKTEKFINPESQLAEIALSTDLVQKNTKLKIQKVSYIILSKDLKPQELTYSSQEIDKIITIILTQKISKLQEWLTWQPNQHNAPPQTNEQQLCQICPQKTKCQMFFNPHSARKEA